MTSLKLRTHISHRLLDSAPWMSNGSQKHNVSKTECLILPPAKSCTFRFLISVDGSSHVCQQLKPKPWGHFGFLPPLSCHFQFYGSAFKTPQITSYHLHSSQIGPSCHHLTPDLLVSLLPPWSSTIICCKYGSQSDFKEKSKILVFFCLKLCNFTWNKSRSCLNGL